jgi:hypothetical protein
MLHSRVLWKVHSKDHAVAAPPSTTTNPATALHHYQGLNFLRVRGCEFGRVHAKDLGHAKQNGMSVDPPLAALYLR